MSWERVKGTGIWTWAAVLLVGGAVALAGYGIWERAGGPAEKPLSPAAMRAMQQVLDMPENSGIERFFITDINNPAATAPPSRHTMMQWDFEDPAVQQRVAELAAKARGLGVTASPPGSPGMYRAPGSEPNVPFHEDPSKVYWPGHMTEEYDRIVENRFVEAAYTPLSTFSIDVDTASYANVRRYLNQGALPPRGAVRIEELVNYFTYDYAPPSDGTPFATHLDLAHCPWREGNLVARVGLKGREIDLEERPPANLVFLIDVSGSMQPENKLPLVKRSLRLLVERLRPEDRIALAVYAGSSGLVLPSTPGGDTGVILDAVERLQSGGSTNGGEGIQLAYRVAGDHYIEGGVNRVILATDGDFNVGLTDQSELTRLIERKRESGVFLTVLGFGMGNLNDSTLEMLANKGNGAYAYIDSIAEARRVLVEQAAGTLLTIAKDVKVQVEFNPARVHAYRLIGYENRVLDAEDFQDDRVDAGEIGAGHTVTALYEITPLERGDASGIGGLRYQRRTGTPAAESGEWLTVKLRYKEPEGSVSRELAFPLAGDATAFKGAPKDFQFAASVAAWGMLLRDSEHRGMASYEDVAAWARRANGWGDDTARREFIELVERAAALTGGS